MESQENINNSQSVVNSENSFFKWAIGIMLGVLFTFVGIVYTSITTSIANAQNQIDTLKQQQIVTGATFQNLQSNVYLLCKSQNLNCIPPINN